MKLLAITLLSHFLFSLALSLESIDTSANALNAGVPIPNNYIVQFKDAVSDQVVESHLDWVKNLVSTTNGRVIDGQQQGIQNNYNIGSFKAYSGVFSPEVIQEIKKRSDVSFDFLNAPSCGFHVDI